MPPASAHKPTSSLRTPQTPSTRPLSHHYPSSSSPSTHHTHTSEIIILHLTPRALKIGLSASALPAATIPITPLLLRRHGDFRPYTDPTFAAKWRLRMKSLTFGGDYILYPCDLRRGLDLGLLADILERVLRDAVSRELCIAMDGKPKRWALVTETGVPLPVLNTVLGVLFGGFAAQSVGLWAESVMVEFAAGVRGAVVVDVGWEETVVTVVGEFRECARGRSMRAGRWLGFEVWKVLVRAIGEELGEEFEGVGCGFEEFERSRRLRELICFEEVEDVLERVVWCQPKVKDEVTEPERLASVQGEEGKGHGFEDTNDSTMTIPLTSTLPPRTINLPFKSLSDIVERTFFPITSTIPHYDDNELPLALLIHKTLINLPHELRHQSLSRIIITGTASEIPGFKHRLIAEVEKLITNRVWDMVEPSPAVEATRKRQEDHKTRQFNKNTEANGGIAREASRASKQAHDQDPIDSLLARTSLTAASAVRGVEEVKLEIRGLESLGAWSGTSLATTLKLASVVCVEKEAWMSANGVGAGQARSRNSVGGLVAGSGGVNLGVFGTGF